jgi:hypothetical protein
MPAHEWLAVYSFFQFKASNYQLKTGRRFYLPHGQLLALKNRVTGIVRSVFYAFLLIGSSVERAADSDLQTWLLDGASLSTIGPPTTRTGTLRKNELHYVDVTPGLAVIRSEPVRAPLLSVLEGVGSAQSRVLFPGADGLQGLIGETSSSFGTFGTCWHPALQRYLCLRAVNLRHQPRCRMPSCGPSTGPNRIPVSCRLVLTYRL